jgi:hypothetical protein
MTEEQLAAIEARANGASPMPFRLDATDTIAFIAALREARRERDQAILARCEAARLRGEAEGALAASEMAGVVDGWKRAAEKAERERDEARAALASIEKSRADADAVTARVREIMASPRPPTEEIKELYRQYKEAGGSLDATMPDYSTVAASARAEALAMAAKLCDAAKKGAKAKLAAAGHPITEKAHGFARGVISAAESLACDIRALIPEPPKPAPASLNRVTRDEAGELDEIVTDGGCHFEHMGGKAWFLTCLRKDRSSVAVWIVGTVTLVEERDAP